MQIVRGGNLEFELRSKDTTVTLNHSIKIGDFEITTPGEYEVAGVMVEASAASARIHIEDFVVGRVAPRSAILSDQELEELGAVDIIFFTIGDGHLPTKEATKLIAQVEASLAIPLATAEGDLTELCATDVSCDEQTGPLKLSRLNLPVEGTRVIVFR